MSRTKRPESCARIRCTTRRRRNVRAVLLFIVAGVFCAGLAAAQSGTSLGDKLDTQKQKLEELEKEIKAHRAKSKELGAEEQNVVKQLSSLEKEMALSKKYLAGVAEREGMLNEQIDSLRIDIAYESHTLEVQRKLLAKRLRQMYMRGPNFKWEVMLGSSDIQNVLRRYKFLGLVAQRDARLVHEVQDRKLGLEHERAVLTESLADIIALKQDKLEESDRLDKTKRARVAVLNKIRTEKSQHDEAVDELRKSQERLRDLISELERKRLSNDTGGLPAGEFAKLKGKLIRPVEGRITKTFGQNKHPKFGTVTFNNGVNIKAAAGTPIRSVAAGKVEFVDWISGYGNCIILNHGGGYYTLYAHAADIFVKTGQNVGAREVIAEVGDSGSLEGYECHFEIRKSKEALNPMDWFAK